MGITITSQFELRNSQFNFKRDYYDSLDELYQAPLTDFPNYFVTNVHGTFYMLDKSKAKTGNTDVENAKLCWIIPTTPSSTTKEGLVISYSDGTENTFNGSQQVSLIAASNADIDLLFPNSSTE